MRAWCFVSGASTANDCPTGFTYQSQYTQCIKDAFQPNTVDTVRSCTVSKNCPTPEIVCGSPTLKSGLHLRVGCYLQGSNVQSCPAGWGSDNHNNNKQCHKNVQAGTLGNSVGVSCKSDARNIPGYFLGEHASNFNAAKSYCEEKGTTLALIKDEESQQKAAAACGKHTCWIGLVEHGGQDGTWKWLDGETLSYSNWNEGEPNNFQGNDEKNAMMNCCEEDIESPNGKWHDVSEGFESARPLCGEEHGNNNDTTSIILLVIIIIVLLLTIVVFGFMCYFFCCNRRKNKQSRRASVMMNSHDNNYQHDHGVHQRSVEMQHQGTGNSRMSNIGVIQGVVTMPENTVQMHANPVQMHTNPFIQHSQAVNISKIPTTQTSDGSSSSDIVSNSQNNNNNNNASRMSI